jgi:hypothetical protein
MHIPIAYERAISHGAVQRGMQRKELLVPNLALLLLSSDDSRSISETFSFTALFGPWEPRTSGVANGAGSWFWRDIGGGLAVRDY